MNIRRILVSFLLVYLGFYVGGIIGGFIAITGNAWADWFLAFLPIALAVVWLLRHRRKVEQALP